MIDADTFITRGSSGVTGAGLLASEPEDFVDLPRCRSNGNVSCLGALLLQAASTTSHVTFILHEVAKPMPANRAPTTRVRDFERPPHNRIRSAT